MHISVMNVKYFVFQGESEGGYEALDFINPKGVRFIPKKDGEYESL